MNSLIRSIDIGKTNQTLSYNEINEWSLQGSRSSYKQMKWKWSKVIHGVFADYLPIENFKKSCEVRLPVWLTLVTESSAT